MAEKMEIPVFATEAEESKWWPSQEDRIADEFERAGSAGELGRGTAAQRAALAAATIRLDPKDVELARSQAESKGIQYQTYVKMLLHEALRARETSAT